MATTFIRFYQAHIRRYSVIRFIHNSDLRRSVSWLKPKRDSRGSSNCSFFLFEIFGFEFCSYRYAGSRARLVPNEPFPFVYLRTLCVTIFFYNDVGTQLGRPSRNKGIRNNRVRLFSFYGHFSPKWSWCDVCFLIFVHMSFRILCVLHVIQ